MCFSTHPSCAFAQADKMCNVFQETWVKHSVLKCWNFSILMFWALILQDYAFPKQWGNQTINTKKYIYRCIFLISATSEWDSCLVFFCWLQLRDSDTAAVHSVGLSRHLDKNTWLKPWQKMSSSLTVRKFSIVYVPSTWWKWAHARLGWLASKTCFGEPYLIALLTTSFLSFFWADKP